MKKQNALILAVALIALLIIPASAQYSEKTKQSMELIVRGREHLVQGRYKEALAYFRQAVKIQPRSAEAHYYVAVANYWLEDYNNAYPAIQAALNLDKENHMIWYYFGKIANARQSPREALGCFEKAIELQPNFKDAWFGKGQVLYSLKHYRQSIAAMGKVSRMDPGEARAWIFMGMSYYWLGDTKQAKYFLGKGVSMDPSAKDKIESRIRNDLGIK